MLPAHKDIIRTNYNKLRQAIKEDIKPVCKDLYSAKVISKDMMDRILESNNNNADRAMALLDILPTRGPYAFEQLYKSCVAKELNGAADILRPDLTTHFKSARADEPTGNHNGDDDLPDAWPSEEIISSGIQVRKVNTDDVQIIEFYRYSLSPEGQKKYYSMKNKIKGHALVINNEKFTYLQNREGTLRDRKSIESVFKEECLGFEVTVHPNKTGEEMLKILKDEAALDHSRFDCFMLFILSHGHEGVVFGIDGRTENNKHYNYVTITEIRKMFSSVTTLIGKPKIFFIQACQGNAKDTGMFTNPADRPVGDVTLSPGPTLNTGSSAKPEPMDVIVSPALNTGTSINAEPMDETLSPGPALNMGSSTKAVTMDVIDNKRADSPPVQLKQIVLAEVTEVVPVHQEASDRSLSHVAATKPSSLDSNEEVNIRHVKRALRLAWEAELEQSDAVGEKTPSLADTFIAMATTPGNLSWRNTKYGTWFIQAITFVFAKYAYKNDLQKLMTQVNNLVSKAETIKGKYKQVAEKTDTFTKSLYLFPGLPAENT
ncbi:unnamed protein product [Lymnaea stagnalis]|uniref:Uncharacterized protein n=1 Tax=Lymnaea stagnalis TaxID=6523 RepID=A0AAV2I961_LYMST